MHDATHTVGNVIQNIGSALNKGLFNKSEFYEHSNLLEFAGCSNIMDSVSGTHDTTYFFSGFERITKEYPLLKPSRKMQFRLRRYREPSLRSRVGIALTSYTRGSDCLFSLNMWGLNWTMTPRNVSKVRLHEMHTSELGNALFTASSTRNGTIMSAEIMTHPNAAVFNLTLDVSYPSWRHYGAVATSRGVLGRNSY